MLNCADWKLWLGWLRGVQREQEERVVGAGARLPRRGQGRMSITGLVNDKHYRKKKRQKAGVLHG